MSVFAIFLFSFLSANATLDKSGHLMFVEYSINQPTKDEGVIYVDILFHYKGETYMVARHRYPEPITSIVDTFPWVSKDKWEGGDLEVVAKKADGSVERSYISEKSIEVKDLSYEPPKFEREVNGALVKLDDGPDPYAWRMLGYDPGHTGYYPFSLYPPLDSLWMYDWSGAGTWTTEISGCAGHDMLFIPLAPWGWNRIAAFDVERGDTIWERVLTANVWTSVLSLNDSTLFVGTSIGYTPWKDTTFYALDPFTGKFKWGKSLKTVEYSPIVVDTFVYAPHFYKVYCFTYGGDSVWAANSAYSSPVYEYGIIVGAATDSVLNARDYLTGELIWDFTGRGDIFNSMGYEGKIIFSPFFDPLYALDSQTGGLVWKNWEYGRSNVPLNGGYSKIFWGHGLYVEDTMYTIFKVISSTNGEFIWDTLLPPADTNQGRMTKIVVSQDTILWIPNCGKIYVLKNDSVIYYLDLPKSPAQFPNGQFPIAYKNKLTFAHEDFLIVYAADTVIDTSGNRDTLSDFTIYPVYAGLRNALKIILPFRDYISLSLYSVTGRKVWEYRAFMEKGENLIYLPDLASSIYFLKYRVLNHSDVKKILYLNRRQ